MTRLIEPNGTFSGAIGSIKIEIGNEARGAARLRAQDPMVRPLNVEVLGDAVSELVRFKEGDQVLVMGDLRAYVLADHNGAEHGLDHFVRARRIVRATV